MPGLFTVWTSSSPESPFALGGCQRDHPFRRVWEMFSELGVSASGRNRALSRNNHRWDRCMQRAEGKPVGKFMRNANPPDKNNIFVKIRLSRSICRANERSDTALASIRNFTERAFHKKRSWRAIGRNIGRPIRTISPSCIATLLFITQIKKKPALARLIFARSKEMSAELRLSNNSSVKDTRTTATSKLTRFSKILIGGER